MNITEELFKMQDKEYKAFHAKLIPNVNPDFIIGVRTPHLRKFSNKINKTQDAATFLKFLPHTYYEENNLHAFLIEKINDFDSAIYETERFLPFVDNWATCDMFRPKIFKKCPCELLKKINEWIASEKIYTVRYAIGLMLSFYLDDEFSENYLKLVANVKSDEYYVNMMIAWFFATALAKQYDAAIEYITSYKLSPWVHNKTIQKAVESNRTDKEVKAFLKTFKI